MNLGVVSQRLEVSRALNRGRYRFAVGYPALSELGGYAEALGEYPLHDLKLHLSHQRDAYLICLLAAPDGKGRVLVLEGTQGAEQDVVVDALGRSDRPVKDGLEYGAEGPAARTDNLPDIAARKSQHRADLSLLGSLGACIFLAAVYPDAADLFCELPALAVGVGQGGAHRKAAPRDADMREPCPRAVIGNLEDPRREFLSRRRQRDEFVYAVKQLLNALEPQG